MSFIQTAKAQIGGLEDLARLDSPLHRLDPRALLLVTIGFVVAVVSFPPHALAPLALFGVYPILVFSLARFPARPFAMRLLLAAPFVLLVGAANPFLDREIVAHVGTFGISGGWVSFFSIAMRLMLTVLAALLLVAIAGMDGVALALERMGAPRLLVQQLLLMHRYLSVLIDEGARIQQAHALRSDGRGIPLAHMGPLAGQWLLRSLDRAHRIHLAMLSRGFDGRMPRLRQLHFRWADAAWIAGWCAFFLIARWQDLPTALGRAVMEGLR